MLSPPALATRTVRGDLTGQRVVEFLPGGDSELAEDLCVPPAASARCGRRPRAGEPSRPWSTARAGHARRRPPRPSRRTARRRRAAGGARRPVGPRDAATRRTTGGTARARAASGCGRTARPLFAETIVAFGCVDAVGHSVDGRIASTPVADVDLDGFDGVCRFNTRATLIVNREAARQVRDGGAIVNLSSSTVVSASPTFGAYAASKAATDVLTGTRGRAPTPVPSRSTPCRSTSTGPACPTGSPNSSCTCSLSTALASPAA